MSEIALMEEDMSWDVAKDPKYGLELQKMAVVKRYYTSGISSIP
jgi:hypothetical protein